MSNNNNNNNNNNNDSENNNQEYITKKVEEHEREFTDVYDKIDELSEKVNEIDKSRVAMSGLIRNSNDLQDRLDRNVEKITNSLEEMGKTMVSMQCSLNENKEDIKSIRDSQETTDNKVNNFKDTAKDFLIDIGKTTIKIAISGGLLAVFYEFIVKGKVLNLF